MNDDGLVSHTHTQTPEEVAAYWTPERMAEAKPVPMPTMTPLDAAAHSLNEHAKNNHWFMTVGAADGAEPKLYLYTNTTTADFSAYANGWCGFPVEVKKLGTPKPA